MAPKHFTIGYFLITVFSVWALAADRPAAQVNPEALKRWQDMRFGMFIHWGPVSLTGHEIGWSRGRETPVEQYDQLYKRFDPEHFNADDWVKVAKQAGMKYVILTTKHHDGFCLWDTKQTDFNMMNSPLGRDVVKELSDACKRQGIAFGTYYSTCDWHHPDFPRTSPGGQVKRDTYNLDRYTEYLKAQVKELLVNYGPLITLWYDVPQEFDRQRGESVIAFTRALQPSIVINNRTGAPGDFDTPEQRVGGFNRERPWETCMTICRQWAWKPDDTMKSLKQCLQTLIYTAGGDGNLLFNVGPMPDGRIEPRQVERLMEMGQWMQQYGDTIYGTRGGPLKPGRWGASTCKDNKVFLFIMNWPQDGPFLIPTQSLKIQKAIVRGGGVVTFKNTKAGIELDIPIAERNEIASVVELTVAGRAFDIEPVRMNLPSDSVAFEKPAKASNVFQNQKNYEASKAFDDDPETRWATDGGTHAAWLQVDLGQDTTVNAARIDEHDWNRITQFEIKYQSGNEWKTAYKGGKVDSEKTITFDPVRARIFRLDILQATEGPTIWEFQLFHKK